MSAWLVVEAAPDVESGKTFVRAPRPADRTTLSRLADDGPWDSLRDAAEDALSEHPFWLDLHRWSALALERLGPESRVAREAVGREVSAFVARVPGLVSLSFSNGTPFASPETIDWIAAESARYGGAKRENRAAGAPDAASKDLLEDARARAETGALDEALASALHAADLFPTARARFQARLGLAKLAHAKGKTAIALALFERLLPEVDATLEAWEPVLCAELLESYLKALRSAPGELDARSSERDTLLFRRLLSLDAAAALQLGA